MKNEAAVQFSARYPWVGSFFVGILFGIIVCAVVLVTVVINQRQVEQRQVENLGRVAPPSAGFATSEGWFLTPGQPAAAIAISDDPRLASAERYLLDQGGFKGGVRINLDSCRAGLAGTHWDRDYRSIVNCFSPLSAFHTALQNRHEPDAGRITQDAALFVLLHEIGHSFLADRQVPFLGREEDAADEIAALLAIDPARGSSSSRLRTAARAMTILILRDARIASAASCTARIPSASPLGVAKRQGKRMTKAVGFYTRRSTLTGSRFFVTRRHARFPSNTDPDATRSRRLR